MPTPRGAGRRFAVGLYLVRIHWARVALAALIFGAGVALGLRPPAPPLLQPPAIKEPQLGELEEAEAFAERWAAFEREMEAMGQELEHVRARFQKNELCFDECPLTCDGDCYEAPFSPRDRDD